MTAGVKPPETPGSETPPAPAKKRGGGPRTPEGKEQSKRNALKHGMRAKVLLPDDLAAAVEARTEELAGGFGPGAPYEGGLGGGMGPAPAQNGRRGGLAILHPPRPID